MSLVVCCNCLGYIFNAAATILNLAYYKISMIVFVNGWHTLNIAAHKILQYSKCHKAQKGYWKCMQRVTHDPTRKNLSIWKRWQTPLAVNKDAPTVQLPSCLSENHRIFFAYFHNFLGLPNTNQLVRIIDAVVPEITR